MHRRAHHFAAAGLLWAMGQSFAQVEPPRPAPPVVPAPRVRETPTAETPPSPVTHIPWRSATYAHVADDEPLATLLREFASDQGVAIVVSEKVVGKVRGRFGPIPPQQYLDMVTRQNGLIWYFDGSAIFVYRGDELESEIFQLRRVSPDAVLAAMRDLDVPVEPMSFRISKDGTLIQVVGAPRFVQIVRNIALRLEGTAVQKVATSLSIRVFPLKHAWADDRTVAFNESTVTVPGVASILRNLVGLQSKTPQGGGVRKVNPLTSPTLAGKGLASVGENARQTPLDPNIPQPPGGIVGRAGGPLGTGQGQQQQQPSLALESEAGQQPSIQEEPRLNAIIIQDTPDRFPVYEQLISALDVPVGLVEIEALIIDVNSSKNFAFGLPWTVSTQNGANSVSLQATPTDQANLVFTLVTGGVQRLLVQLQALASEGHAKVVARPAVLTQDNIEAHLESTQTIYVRVPGTYSSDLFNIVVGTTLRVTPHIIDEGGQRKIKVQVRVEDGTPLPVTVDAIPTVQRNSVTTQAVLAEDQSLFIGGLTRDDKHLQVRGIPWLKDLPRIGAFFRTSVSTVEKLERYVLLTPRIISLEPPAGITPPCGGENGICPPDAIIPAPMPIAAPEPTASALRKSPSKTSLAASPKPSIPPAAKQAVAPKLVRLETTDREPPPQALRPPSMILAPASMSFRTGETQKQATALATAPLPPPPAPSAHEPSAIPKAARPMGAVKDAPEQRGDRPDDDGWKSLDEWSPKAAAREPKLDRR